MNNQDEFAFKSFSSEAMLDNINSIKSIIQRIRQKEGGVGSVGDELCLHRGLQDLDLLVDMANGLRTSYEDVRSRLDTVSATAETLQNQHKSLKVTYEKMLEDRNEHIKTLETKLGIRPKKTKKKKK